MANSVKINGKEVQNPILRGLVITIAVLFVTLIVIFIPFLLVGVLGLSFGIIAAGIGLAILVASLTIPLHFILRLCGRRGFFTRDGNTYTWAVNANGFTKHEQKGG